MLGREVMSVLQAGNEDLGELGMKIFAALSRGEKWAGEWKVRRKDGVVIDLMVSEWWRKLVGE